MLGPFKDKTRKLLESITGYRVVGLGKNLVVVAHKNSLGEIWFSYDMQLETVLEKHRVNLVLDVGANQGQFVGTLRKFYQGKILSFEPIPAVFNELQNAAVSDPQWDVFNLALGSQDTTLTLNVSQSSVFSSFLKTNDYCHERFGANADGATQEIVSVKRLDNLIDKIIPEINGARIFLKMDTQGYDLEVFKGLGSLCKQVVALQTEVSVIQIYKDMCPWTESISFFEKAGFEVIGLFPVNRDSLRIVEYDCMMTNCNLNAPPTETKS